MKSECVYVIVFITEVLETAEDRNMSLFYETSTGKTIPHPLLDTNKNTTFPLLKKFSKYNR